MYKIGELHSRLLGTKSFLAKAKNERFSAAGSRCRQNLKNENFTSLIGRLRQKFSPKSVPHVQHIIFPHSTNQIIDLCGCRCQSGFLNSPMSKALRSLRVLLLLMLASLVKTTLMRSCKKRHSPNWFSKRPCDSKSRISFQKESFVSKLTAVPCRCGSETRRFGIKRVEHEIITKLMFRALVLHVLTHFRLFDTHWTDKNTYQAKLSC